MRWAVNQPIRWGIGYRSKEYAEAQLAKLRSGWDRSETQRDVVLYVLQAEDGTWDVYGAKLHRKPEELAL